MRKYHPCKPLYFADWKSDKRLIVYLDGRLKDLFKAECELRGLKMNEVIREFVTRWTMRKYRDTHNLTREQTESYKKQRHKQS